MPEALEAHPLLRNGVRDVQSSGEIGKQQQNATETLVRWGPRASTGFSTEGGSAYQGYFRGGSGAAGDQSSESRDGKCEETWPWKYRRRQLRSELLRLGVL